VAIGTFALWSAVPLLLEAVLADFLGRTTGNDILTLNMLAVT